MKARMPAEARLTNRQRAVLYEAADKAVRAREREHIRRIFKLLCVSLHESYGFGRGRLEHVLRTISSLSAEHERDEVYWAHIDRVVIDGLGMEFAREAEE